MVAKPGVRPGMPPSRPAGPRPQHPTTRGRIEPGLAPPPVEPARGRPGQRPVRQQRERVEEEKVLRPQRRHETQPHDPNIAVVFSLGGQSCRKQNSGH
jgi:hypothetical protein